MHVYKSVIAVIGVIRIRGTCCSATFYLYINIKVTARYTLDVSPGGCVEDLTTPMAGRKGFYLSMACKSCVAASKPSQ